MFLRVFRAGFGIKRLWPVAEATQKKHLFSQTLSFVGITIQPRVAALDGVNAIELIYCGLMGDL